MPSHREAHRLIKSHFHERWAAGIANGLPNADPVLEVVTFSDGTENYVPRVYYQNVEPVNPLDLGRHFVRFSLSNLTTSQSSLPGGRLHQGKTKFTTPGVGAAELFFSKQQYSTKGEEYLCAIAHDAFVVNTPSGVWFRNATIKNLPAEENFFRACVTFDYEYDTHLRT